MADNKVPVPQGATIDNMSSDQSQPSMGTGKVPVPQGAIIGNTTQDMNQNQPTGHHVTDTAFGQNEPGFTLRGAGNAIVSGVGGALEGAGEGIFKGAAGATDLVNKVAGTHLNPTIAGHSLHELAGDNEQKTTAEKFGYGGETLTEFMLGDEALKGLALSDKLINIAKTMKIFEKSPKIMSAIKLGAQALESGAKAGAVQGAQTLVRTGGDTKQALEDAKTMAKFGAGAGVVGAGLGAAGEKIGSKVKAFGRLQEAGEGTSATHVITSDVKDAIDKSEENLHKNYESNIQNFNQRLQGEELDPKDNSLPMSQKADELLQKPVPGDHQLETDLKKSLKEGLQPDVKTLLSKIRSGFNADIDMGETIDIKLPKSKGTTGGNQIGGQTANKITTDRYQYLTPSGDISPTPVPNGRLVDLSQLDPEKFDFTNGTYTGQVSKGAIIDPLEPYNIDNLIGIRQLIRRKMSDLSGSLGPGNTNTRTLRALLGSVDDTIETLARQGNDPGLADEYRALRDDYRSKIGIYDDTIINNLREGKYGDAAKQLLSGGNTMAPKLQNLKTILGDAQFNNIAKDAFGHLIENSRGPHGEVNPARLLENWKQVPEESRNTLFGYQGVPQTKVNQLMSDAKTARNLQYLSRMGVIGPLAAQSGFLYHMGIIGSLLASGETVGAWRAADKLGGVRQVIDYIADHPKMWKTWGMLGEALQSPRAGKAVTGAVGQTVTGANNPDRKRQILSGASGLSGQ